MTPQFSNYLLLSPALHLKLCHWKTWMEGSAQEKLLSHRDQDPQLHPKVPFHPNQVTSLTHISSFGPFLLVPGFCFVVAQRSASKKSTRERTGCFLTCGMVVRVLRWELRRTQVQSPGGWWGLDSRFLGFPSECLSQLALYGSFGFSYVVAGLHDYVVSHEMQGYTSRNPKLIPQCVKTQESNAEPWQSLSLYVFMTE